MSKNLSNFLFRKCCFLSGLLLLLFLAGEPVFAQDEHQDSVKVETPFRKGRWLTGLSGSITSGANSLDTARSGFTNNRYSIDLRSSKFVKNRLALGGLFSLSRDDTEGFVERTLETFYVGPVLSWYLYDDDQGSLFINGSGGFTTFRDESIQDLNGVISQTLVDGDGVAALIRFGYSYVLHDRIAFELGLSFSHSWLSASVTEQPADTVRRQNFTVSDLAFSFGFSVLLDRFFF